MKRSKRSAIYSRKKRTMRNKRRTYKNRRMCRGGCGPLCLAPMMMRGG